MELNEQGGKAEEPIVDPEEDFGDGGGGCQHPECAIEHIIAHSVESIMEAVAAFDYHPGWELSPIIVVMLREFGEALVESFQEQDEEEARALGMIVGTPYPQLRAPGEDDESD